MRGTKTGSIAFGSCGRPLLSGVATLTTLVTAQPLLAQATPPTREQIEAPVRQESEEQGRSRLSVEGGIERGACPLASPENSGVTVRFSRVDFGAQQVVPEETLRPSWEGHAGREVPVSALCDVRDRAATILRGLGYLAAVQVPPQKIEGDGVVSMDVLAARLVDVRVRGDTGRGEELIAAHMRKLTDRPYFNSREAERHLLLARDIPGYDVRLVLRPAGTTPGEVIGDVQIVRTPFELYAGIQNLGSRSIGREGGFVQLTANDLIGLGDRTTVSIFNTFEFDEQTVIQISHDLALGASGARIGGKLIYGHAEPEFGNGDFKTESWIAQVAASYPFIRRENLTVGGVAGFEMIDQKVEFTGTPISEDDLRVVFAQANFSLIDRPSLSSQGGFSANEPRWRVNGLVELRQGIGGLGASRDCSPLTDCLAPNVAISRIDADPSGFVAKFRVDTEYRPVPEFTVAASYMGQFSPDPLLPFEQFSLGNYTVARGFDPGLVQGDSGFGYAVELRYGRITPSDPDEWRLQPFVFFDSGWTWTKNSGALDDPQRLQSAGGGVRARWGDHADLSAMLAIPVSRDDFTGRDTGDVRLLFTFTTRLIPWSRR